MEDFCHPGHGKSSSGNWMKAETSPKTETSAVAYETALRNSMLSTSEVIQI